ncbi:hypothetical protein CFOL_v3_11265 [Cephalotus follicularis]|uniref:Import inner membrane translocase subunit n=1 Tax=Cephalotus follicularis TaxID=3775 RepID=A0A1Q3BIG8_CEPFO|nr:hypothetical protein CFOL_v3_11265 [Cephalotus follicularis]
MSKSSSRIILGLLKIHCTHQLKLSSKPNAGYGLSSLSSPFRTTSASKYTNLPYQTHSKLNLQLFSSTPTSSNLGLSQIISSPIHNRLRMSPTTHCTKLIRSSGFRFLSNKTSNFGQKLNGDFAKRAFEKPATVVTSAFSKYREAIGLQIDAFMKRNYLFLLGAGGVLVCALLWRIMFGIANTFVGLSEGMAKYGFLALSSAIVAFAGLYLRSRFTINPDKVYRMAMRRLNTAAEILEVMGAPLTGTELRAYVMSGGGITLKNFKPVLRSKRCFLIFPIRGSERKGLVSVEVKKKKGQYDTKLLAVDIPMASGPDQRLYLIGDEEEYQVGGGLISELRDPVVKAMTAIKEFDDLDRIEEEEDAERELLEAEIKHREEIEKLEKDRSQ